MVEMTYRIANAAARDAANRQMRAAGRTSWSHKDYNLACCTLDRLFPECLPVDLAPVGEKESRTQPDTITETGCFTIR